MASNMAAIEPLPNRLPPRPPAAPGLRLLDGLLLASLLLPLMLFAALAAYDRRETLASAERDLQIQLLALEAHTRRVLETQALLLEMAAEGLRGLDSAAIAAEERRHHDFLRALRRASPQSLGLVVFGPDGRPLVDSDRYPVDRQIDIGDRDFFTRQRERAEGGLHLSRPVSSRGRDGALVFVLSLRRSAGDGRFDGIVSAGLPVGYFTDFWSGIDAGPDSAVSLVREDGAIIARSPPVDPLTAPPLGDASPMMRAIAEGREGATLRGRSTVDGTERLFAYRKLAGFPAYVGYGISSRTALGSWRRDLALYGAFAGLAALALFTLTLMVRRRTLALMGTAAALERERAEIRALNAGLEQRVAERTAALRETTALLRAVTETTPDPIYAKDREGRLLLANPATLAAIGRPAAAAIGRSEAEWASEPAQAAALRENDRRIIASGATERFEETFTGASGRRIYLSTKSPLRDARGAIIGLVGVSTDITERKAAEERQRLLAQEVDHRAKNMLAVVQSVVRLTRAERLADYKAALDGRIAALARAHALLAESRWQGAGLRQLAEEELAPYRAAGDGRVRLAGPPLTLAPAAAQALAMALHELATNAAKYGALSRPEGRVELAWELRPTGSLCLRWRETGGPPTGPPARRGVGTTVVERSIGDQLAGQASFDWRTEGLLCEIVLPADKLAGAPREREPPPFPSAAAGED